MNSNDIPSPYGKSPTTENQRQVIKTKIIGRVESSPDYREAQEKAEAQAQKDGQNNESEARADKNKSEMLDRAGEMRHLRYDIIEDADIVQVSVINSKEGTIIRKVPPDKVVSFVKKIKEDKKTKLDLQA